LLIYEPKYFSVQELVSPAIYEVCGEDSLYLYHPNILEGADKLREFFGPMVCNTWHDQKMIKKHGLWRDRGLRSLNAKTGAKLSCHRVGVDRVPISNAEIGVVPYSAIDLVPINCKVSDMHLEIRTKQSYWCEFFTRVEACKPDGEPITWFHGDNKPTEAIGKVVFFKP
jgi:hypothetical protein